jgi:hypothetical protein
MMAFPRGTLRAFACCIIQDQERAVGSRQLHFRDTSPTTYILLSSVISIKFTSLAGYLVR